ncbi:MAG: hypothetical protein P4L59_19705 [Desulfosporosinus sp.]|nr:hypothetical protein [Desulfosporosinus sp.]
MKYGPGEFSELSVKAGMKEWIESRQDMCDDPKIYDELPHEVKTVLDKWIEASIVPSKKERSSYGIKTDFHRETGIYVYAGVINGALLKAGYQPMNPKDTNWYFKVDVLKRKNLTEKSYRPCPAF